MVARPDAASRQRLESARDLVAEVARRGGLPLATRGTRTALFFWLQSLGRDKDQRALMFDLDTEIQQLSTDDPDHPVAVKSIGDYHNLLRPLAQS